MTSFVWQDEGSIPPERGRYLVYLECETKTHNCRSWDYAFPCCAFNFMYFDGRDKWYQSTEGDDETKYVKKWSFIPDGKNNG